MPVNARRDHGARTVFVIAVLTIAMGAPADTFPPSPATGPLSQPALVPPDPELEALAIDTVRGLPAAALDAALPAIPLNDWLLVTLAPLVENLHDRTIAWGATFCDDRESAIPGAAPELCVEATIHVASDKIVHLVAAAGVLEHDSNDALPWRLTPPSLREVYIERIRNLTPVDSLDVRALGELTRALRMPADQWPTVDFQSRIAWTPPHPARGDSLHVTIWVGNVGKRSAERVYVKVLIAPCCKGDHLNGDWFPAIAAGKWVRLDRTVSVPEGMALVHVSVSPFRGRKAVRESNPDDNDSAAAIDPWGPRD